MKKVIATILLIVIVQTAGAEFNEQYFSEENIYVDQLVKNDGIDMNDSYNILFIGSSYFNFNDLPYLFSQLSESSGKEVYVDHHGRNGMYLDNHATSEDTEKKIFEQDWDFIILQGVGTNTAYPDYFTNHQLYPALVTLQNKIHENCEWTKMMYCMPWAFEDGMTWYQNWTDTYEDMQLKIYETTVNYSHNLDFKLAPVGWAWYAVLKEKGYPIHYLHMNDWNHPSPRGSYLMACVIYASIYLEEIGDNNFFGGVLEEEAKQFQSVASAIVLGNLSVWNLNEEEGNNPPEKPCMPSGPTQIKSKDAYIYSTVTTDPDDDRVYYLFDWGDGNLSDWIGPCNSTEMATGNYSWEKKGEYHIRVKAKDEYGHPSDWSDPLRVTVSRGKFSQCSFCDLMSERLYLFLDDIKNFLCLFFSSPLHSFKLL